MTGYNTDGAGFVRALRELGWRPGTQRAVVLGAGGASRGVCWELARAGCALTIANRRPERARQLAARLRRAFPALQVQARALRGLELSGADVLINATTVGMHPRDPAPVDVAGLRRGALVYDLIYHRPTALLAAARRRGCVAGGGASMLLYQGAESLRLWLHKSPPVKAMRLALDRALQTR
jgi:shikimate dehydrogenase